MNPLDSLINEFKGFKIGELLAATRDVGIGQLDGEQVAGTAGGLGLEKLEGHILQIFVVVQRGLKQRRCFINPFNNDHRLMLPPAGSQTGGGITWADNFMRESKANHRFFGAVED